jgi:hypothetical protein
MKQPFLLSSLNSPTGKGGFLSLSLSQVLWPHFGNNDFLLGSRVCCHSSSCFRRNVFPHKSPLSAFPRFDGIILLLGSCLRRWWVGNDVEGETVMTGSFIYVVIVLCTRLPGYEL